MILDRQAYSLAYCARWCPPSSCVSLLKRHLTHLYGDRSISLQPAVTSSETVNLGQVLKQQLVLYTPPLREEKDVHQKGTFLVQHRIAEKGSSPKSTLNSPSY